MNDKKRFLLLALAAALCLAFFPACSSDSDSGSDSVVGTWIDEDGDPLVLNSDGTFELWGQNSGTYTVSGSTLTITDSAEGATWVFTIAGNTLEGVSATWNGSTESFPFNFTRR